MNHLTLCDLATGIADTQHRENIVTDSERMKAIDPPTLVFVFANYIRSTAGAEVLDIVLSNAEKLDGYSRHLNIEKGDAA